MRNGSRIMAGIILTLAMFAVVVEAGIAVAVEYRLRVASVHDSALGSYLDPAEFRDAASGPGLDRLEASLDNGAFPPGGALYDRPSAPAAEMATRALGAVAVRVELTDPASAVGRWQEFRWDGRPGERTLWVVAPSAIRYAQLERVALKGRGPLRQFRPYTMGLFSRGRREAFTVPLQLIWTALDRGTPGDPFLSRTLSLDNEIAAIVGVNQNRSFADQVYLLVVHAEKPSTYKAVLGWLPRQDRPGEVEAPDFNRP